jgi:hypothetical protein
MMRWYHTILLLAAVGGLFMLFGILESDCLWSDASWSQKLGCCAFLFLLGVWAGYVMLTRDGTWAPRYRRWLHAFGFLLLIGVTSILIAHPDLPHLLIIGAVTAIAGYFGEVWIEYVF